MPASGNRLVFDIKYTANSRSELVKHVMFNGMRLRESDGSSILALQSFENRKTFAIEVGAVEWIKIDGKIRKLRAPKTQSRLREAELKFLLQGKREGLSDPSLRSYELDEIVQVSQSRRGLFGWILYAVGLVFLSLPGLATIGVLGMLGYMVVKMLGHTH